LQKLQQELQTEVSSGAIASSDQSALSTALTDIDTALRQGGAGDPSSGTRPSRDQMQSRIDDLIAGEVSNGTLTSDQATELKGVFKAAFANGPGGAGGAGGPPPSGDSPDSSPTDSTSSTSSDSTTAQILQQFLQALQQSMSSSTSSYGSSGNTGNASGSSQVSALLVDYQT
jgi:hypothetical protein